MKKMFLLLGLVLLVALVATGIHLQKAHAQNAARDQLFKGLVADVLGDKPDLQTTPFGDLRQVVLEYVTGGDSAAYIVHKSQVDRFVEATKKLHYDKTEGNFTKDGALKIKRIQVGSADRSGPYWWTTPSLKGNYDFKNGAVIYDFGRFETVWETPKE